MKRTGLFVVALLLSGTLLGAQDYIFSTSPPIAGAAVSIDGKSAGETDENGRLLLSGIKPGVHLLRVVSGGESYTAQETFDADLNALKPFKIGPATAEKKPPSASVDYRIDTNIADAEVRIDGASVAFTDTAGRATLHLKRGQLQTIEVRKAGFETQAETLAPSREGELKLTLTPRSESSRPRVDVILVALLALLVASVALLVAMLRRRRTRGADSQPVPIPAAAMGEEGIGHFDRYRLVSTLGSGGVATIYRAFDLIDKTLIALKVLDARWLSDPEMVRKFLAEGEALRMIGQRDPSAAVVKCFRYGREHDSIVGRPFIALELLEGETLQTRLDRDSVLDVLTATAVAYQIASALVAVHSAGIVHRDLAPDNIFLRNGDLVVAGARYTVPIVVLIDFGIARQELMSRMTLDGSIAGKPHYMSPEQCRGQTVDTRSDLYSIGIILYRMVAGRLPFAGRDPFEVMRAQMSDPPPNISAQVDKSYADLCESLLQKEAARRPQSAAAVAQELEETLLSLGATSPMNVVSFPARRISL